jgi:uncharacterized protein with NAD-binding domain and iron-sulfur cluster
MSSLNVAIFGGGIAGLTAAHELAERNIDVTLYERRSQLGGKARSVSVGTDGIQLHGEHGFRFFPAYYRNVIDTMKRIPGPENDRTVSDHLVPTTETLITSNCRDEFTTSLTPPQSLEDFLEIVEPNIGGGDVPRRDMFFLFRRMLRLLVSCDRRRLEQWEQTSWWDFVEADQRSAEYRANVTQPTQSLVALRADEGSARTIGQIYFQLLQGHLDRNTPSERILDGPTSVTWIEPWRTELDRLGVSMRSGYSLRELVFDGQQIYEAIVGSDSNTMEITADYYIPIEEISRLATDTIRQAAPSLTGIDALETAWMSGIQYFLTEDAPIANGHVVYTDSPWALTSISQQQFWRKGPYSLIEESNGRVQGVLSVIASDWDTPGDIYGKPAKHCSPSEIKEEVWAQMKDHLNRDGNSRLQDEMIYDWMLAPDIVESDHGVANQSQLFINTVGSYHNRPQAGTQVENLLIAGDYVQTASDLATMESANEAGRRAVNEVLDRSGVSGQRCITWGLREPRLLKPVKYLDGIVHRYLG